jgi:hypothetical protein
MACHNEQLIVYGHQSATHANHENVNHANHIFKQEIIGHRQVGDLIICYQPSFSKHWGFKDHSMAISHFIFGDSLRRYRSAKLYQCLEQFEMNCDEVKPRVGPYPR